MDEWFNEALFIDEVRKRAIINGTVLEDKDFNRILEEVVGLNGGAVNSSHIDNAISALNKMGYIYEMPKNKKTGYFSIPIRKLNIW